MTSAYDQFLREKIKMASYKGFDVPLEEINPGLKPHTREIVRWALQGGQRAIFASFGLHKTATQLEILRQIGIHKPGLRLQVAPLGVRSEFRQEVQKRFRHDMKIDLRFIRRDSEIDDPATLYMTNYEAVREGNITVSRFRATSLDEASVLRSYGSKTYQEFLPAFEPVEFKFVATATPSPNRFKELIHYAGYLGVMDTGQALAQPLSAKVLTPTGWCLMGDLKVGDLVIGQNGKPTRVLAVYPQGKKDIFKVTTSDGAFTRCTGEHLWLTRTQYQRNASTKFIQRNPGKDASQYWTTRETTQIAESLECASTGSKNHELPLVDFVIFDSQEVKIDPWLMGLLIGDGCLRKTSVVFSTADQWIAEKVDAIVSQLGLRASKIEHERSDGQPNYDFIISGGQGGKTGRGKHSNVVLHGLRSYELLGKRAWEKRIPSCYLFNSPEVRLATLQGLMDADGTVSKHVENRTTRFCTTSIGLADDVVFIARSLGGTAKIYQREGKTPTGGVGRTQYVVTLRLPNNVNPFQLPRKADLVLGREKYTPVRYITSVELDGEEQAQCIAVEDDAHLYITDDFIVTHNTRFFQRDSEKAGNLTLYPHKEQEFWLWVASWAVFIQKPSDLGHSDTGYDLPAIDVRYHEIASDYTTAGVEKNGQGLLIPDVALGLSAAAGEKRNSMTTRIEKVSELVNESPDDHFVIWHDLEDERHAIQKAIPDVVSVWGSLDLDEREDRIVAFGDGKHRLLSTKPIIAGSGCNFQRHCHREIFAGIGFKFNDFIQAIHRVHRFGQEHPVRIDIIYTESEREVLRTLQAKWKQHEEMSEKMTEIIRTYGLNQLAMQESLARSIGVKRIEVSSDLFTVANNDCVEEAKLQAENSVDLIITSIPFANHYEYTPSYNDFGHTSDNAHFWAQMDFLTPELLRILKPGRVYACHVKDRINFGNVTGAGIPTVSPFHAEALFHGLKHGFDYMGMITVVTDVVRENNQTYRLGYTEMCKDGTKMGVGSPEYILLFHKPQSDRSRGYADMPVTKSKDEYSLARWQVDAHANWRSSGNRLLTAEEMAGYGPAKLAKMYTDYSLENVYDFDFHVRIGEELAERGALPTKFMSLMPGSHHADVWHDIVRMHTLNSDQSSRAVEKHVCPMPFDIVDRLIERYSNKGERVYDPFCGLGTTPYCAILKGRTGGGSELNPAYFMDQVHYLRAAERQVSMPTLFSMEELDGCLT